MASVGNATAVTETHLIKRLEDLCRTVTQPIAFVGALGMLLISGATVTDVVLRWVFKAPLHALNEVTAMTFAVAIAACMTSGMATGANLKVDLLARWMTGRLAACLDAFGAVMLLVFFALLTWQLFLYADQLTTQGRATVMLSLPQGPFIYAAATLLGIATLVQVVMVAAAIRCVIYREGKYAEQEAPMWLTAVVGVIGVVLLALLIWGIVDFQSISSWARRNVGAEVGYAFALMWLLMLTLVPLAAVMGLIGLTGAGLLIGFGPALSAFATEATGFLTNSEAATLPLFLMMGAFAAQAGMATDLYELAHVLVARFRGGLALATIGACAGFGMLTSSSIATASLIGKVSIPEMRNRGYSPALATGCVAAGGTLGAIVPPGSGPLIVFALLTEASIGQLFIASVGPAILCIALYFATVWLYVRISPSSTPKTEHAAAGDVWKALWRSRTTWVVFFLVMGGLYFGVFTDTEAAAVGAFSCFAIALWRKKLGAGRFWLVMAETTAVTAMIYGLIFGANTLSFFVAMSGLAQTFATWFGALGWEPWMIVALLLAGFLVLGSLMESFAVMVITVPIITPLILNMGYDLVWWGVIMLCIVETGLMTPPLGLNVFVLRSITPDVPIWTTFKGVFPFVIADIVKVALLVAFPGITLWLVGTMMK